MRRVYFGLIGMAAAGLGAWACGGGSPVTAPGDPDRPGIGGTANGGASGTTGGSGGEGGGVVIPPGGGVGDACSEAEPCRTGLACTAEVCEPSGTTELGESCIIAAECVADAQCIGTTCVAAGDAAAGEACQTDADCQGGLRCALVGLSLACAPAGTTDAGGDCATSTDCYAGLSCAGGACAPNPTGAPISGVPTFNEVECDEPVESGGTVRALFEVPGASGAAASDFFALPFPSDVRLVNGHPDLTGFPTPGDALLGFDPVARYVDAVEGSASGWGANPVVLFRFSGPIDWDSFAATTPFFFIDVTPGITVAQGYAANGGLQVSYHRGRTNAVCDNWMAVRRFPGTPLTPGHTYAVWINFDYDDASSMVSVAEDGSPIQRSPHLTAALADTAPSDPDLRATWDAYAPLREYIAFPKDAWMAAPDADKILNAAVFTVEDVREPMADLAAAVEAEPVPSITDWVRCDGATPSPCPQAEGDRACGDGTATEYDEYHALVTLPIFQEGTPPYLESGGGVGGTKVRDEAVCLALTVPKGVAMPAAGWPLVIHAHGTGGSFRSHVRDEVAGNLANVTLAGGAQTHFAVLGIDQVEHGPRRGDSTESPNNLFFNFTNPDAARGNPLQGAADQLALARAAAALDVDAATTGGDAIKIDPAAIVFFGHSQGSTHGSLALPYSTVVKAAVLSGNGASIRDALLTKTSPVNIAAVMPFALGDVGLGASGPEVAGGQDHPGLTLLSHWIDPGDPLNYAVIAGRSPLAGQTPKHIFQTYGLGDTFSPPKTLRVYATAGRFDEAVADSSADPPDDLEINPGEEPLAVPVAGNVTVGGASGQTVTLALRQYGPPSGSDGHFVVYDVASANGDMLRFLAMAARGEVPQVGQ